MDTGKKKYHSPQLQEYGSLEELTQTGNMSSFSGAGNWGSGGWNFDGNGGFHHHKHDYS